MRISSRFQSLDDTSNTLTEMGQVVLDLAACRLPELRLGQGDHDEMSVGVSRLDTSKYRHRTYGVSCQRASVVLGSKRVA